jgi:hypothetical protein
MSHDLFTVDGALIEAMAAVGRRISARATELLRLAAPEENGGEPPRAAGISTRT